MKINDFLNRLRSEYTDYQIEASIVDAFLQKENINFSCLSAFIRNEIENSTASIVELLLSENSNMDLKLLENIFEAMIDSNEKKENGVVFTPSYIVNYIIENSVNGSIRDDTLILDPACGSGSFLVSVAEHMHNYLNKSYVEIISDNIFGIDISTDNIRRSKILLTLLAAQQCEQCEQMTFNLVATDSLKVDWCETFDVSSFDYIIGNPPYVNTHDMAKDTIKFLKSTFSTTQKGTFNIYYAFIEHSMKYLAKDGALGFIIPNNYLTITAAESLRRYLSDNHYVSKIIDFGENMIFAPVRTYNSLLFLDNSTKTEISYSVIEKSDDIKSSLYSAQMFLLPTNYLDPYGWKLLAKQDRDNITKIEQCGIAIKNNVKVGIATLRDNVYLLDGYDEKVNLFYKFFDGERYYIEPAITRKIYKISNIKEQSSLKSAMQSIIFPYETIYQKTLTNHSDRTYRILDEDYISNNFPLCYQYLLKCKSILAERDKGKPNISSWYAYGRTQGLTYSCKKLLFPTFSNKPKFMLDDNTESLFCNGYAVIDNNQLRFDVLQKILNSHVMDYYVSKTSYSIAGNFRCYQKKYIQNFSIPSLNSAELQYLSSENNSSYINEFLISKYQLQL